MNYSLVHYLRNLPLRYYLAGGLLSRDEPGVLFFLSTSSASVLVSRRHRLIAYENKIGEIADHPPIPGVPSGPAPIARTFTAKLIARNRLHGLPKIALVADLSAEDLYCNIHNTRNLRDHSIESLLESLHEEPRQVIGVWDETRDFRWAVLGSDLQEVSGRIDRYHSHLMILGIPREFCEECEVWVKTQQGSILGIIPAPIACLRWLIEKIPLGQQTGFFVLQFKQTIVIAAVQNQALRLVRQYEHDIDFVRRELTAIAAELHADHQSPICVWSSDQSPRILASTLSGLALDEEAMKRIHGSELMVRHADGAHHHLRDPAAYLLMWLEGKII
ncbi:MAG TPA: hypothetical protein VFO40_05750 [Chthoniobacterales bacterium]|nr:hypothetical protein [Chthoniobacterales bacterium]